jgi:hypothetical protein
LAGLALACFSALSPAQSPAPQPPLSAVDSDPVRLGTMQGSPPAADKQITFQNAGSFPNIRWTLQHLSELFRLADKARVLADPALAVERMRRGVLAVHGVV